MYIQNNTISIKEKNRHLLLLQDIEYQVTHTSKTISKLVYFSTRGSTFSIGNVILFQNIYYKLKIE